MEEAEHKLKLDRQKEIEQERLAVRRFVLLYKNLTSSCLYLLHVVLIVLMGSIKTLDELGLG